MIFLSFVDFKRGSKQNCTDKLSSDEHNPFYKISINNISAAHVLF